MLALIVVGIAVVLVVRKAGTSGFQTDEFLRTLSEARPDYMAASAVAVLLTYLGRVVRWRVMLRPIKPDAGYRHLLSATLVGFTAVVFFGRPGELVRPYLIARAERVPVSSQVAIWFLERILDLLMVLVLFGVSLAGAELGPTAGPTLKAVVASGGAIALTLGAACVAVLLLSAFSTSTARALLHRLCGFVPAGRVRARLQGAVNGLLDGMRATGSVGTMAELLAWTALEWAVILAAMHFAIISYGPTAHFTALQSMVFTGFVAFGSAVQLPGIGGGMQVAAIVIGTELFGLSLESATALALLLWALTWLVVIPAGLVAAFLEGWKWTAMRRVAAPEESHV